MALRTRAIPVYLNEAEIDALLAAAANDRDRWLIWLLWVTGGRISEVLAVRVGDITAHGLTLPNLKQGHFQKDAEGVKHHVRVRAQKHVILPPEAVARLREATRGERADAPLVARLSDGRPITRQRAWQIVTETALRAGVLKTRFWDGALRPAWCHTLRHSYAVHLLEAGIPVTIVSEQLGHAKLDNTQVYTKISDPRKEQLIAGVSF